MEVLFQYQGRRCALKCKRSVMLDKVQEALISFQASIPGSSSQSASCTIEVHTLQSLRKPGSTKNKKRGENRSIYLLQRYMADWKFFVNVDNIPQVKNRDVITVTQGASPHHSSTAGYVSLPRSQHEVCKACMVIIIYPLC